MKKAFRAAVSLAFCAVLAGRAQAETKVRVYDGEPSRGGVRAIAPAAPSPSGGISPFGIGFVPGLQAPAENWDVWALRISVFACRNRNVYAIDIGGLGNFTEYDMGGVAVSGIFNIVGSSSGSIQTAGLFNRSHGDFDGIQIAGAMSYTEGTMTGFQAGLVNKSNRLAGVQAGALNVSAKGSGVQIGVVNISERLEGLQIGLLNFIDDSPVRFMPLANFSF